MPLLIDRLGLRTGYEHRAKASTRYVRTPRPPGPYVVNSSQFTFKVVADAIRADPETYSDAVLGRSREEYIKTILKPSAWG